MTTVLAANDAGPAPERQVALDMVTRALFVAPIPVVLAALVWGGRRCGLGRLRLRHRAGQLPVGGMDARCRRPHQLRGR